MKTVGRYALHGAVMLLLCHALSGCSTTSQSSSNPSEANSTKVTITEISSDDSSDTQSVGSANKDKVQSNHDVLSTCLGTIAEKFADEHGNPVVQRAKAQEVFSFTIEGDDFELPCPVSAFFDKEWKLEQGYTYDGMSYDPGFSYDVGLWHKGDANYVITIKLKNTSDEIVQWEDLTVVGLTVRPVDSYVSFECKAGIDRDSDLDDLLGVFGCNDESALLDNKTIVEYHVSLYSNGIYDMNASIYGNVAYDWNKTGKVSTSLSFELVEPWDTDLRLSEEDLAKKRKEQEEQGTDGNELGYVGDYVGRTVEGSGN